MKTTSETSERSVIAEELAALGEVELTGAEPMVDDDIDVTTVGTLVGIATADPASLPGLSPLAQRRVWKRLEGRVAAAAFAPVVDDPHTPAANDSGGWRSVVAGLAVAAGFLLVPRLIAPPSTEAVVASTGGGAVDMGPDARAMLDALGDNGAPRARSMAAAYAQRLAGNGGNTP